MAPLHVCLYMHFFNNVLECCLSLLELVVFTHLVLSLSPAASQFLKIYATTFLDVVNPKLSLLKLEHKGVISPDAATAIENANEEDAKYLLFQHLEKNATVDTLREYCKVAIAADGYPRMQEFGRKMMETLPLGGWSHLWLWVGTLSALHVCVPLSHCVHTHCIGLHAKCTALAELSHSVLLQ